MANRLFKISRAPLWPGISAAMLVAVLIFGTLAAVLWRAKGFSALGPFDLAALRFTLWQALLSALLSVLLAVPVARALARRQFPGRSVLLALMGAPFILPVIVAVLGLLAVFGRKGVFSVALGWIGFDPVQIYGLHGVLLAHVFFNLPLAVRLILQGWLSIPSERFRLAASLGFSPRDMRHLLEYPMLRGVLPGVFTVIFIICLTSFTVVLALGGGPKATTVELAIYQAFRFDFDLGRAALLSLMQFGIGAAAALLALWIAVPGGFGAGLDRAVERWDGRGGPAKLMDAGWIIAAAGFLLLPLLMIALRGVPGLALLPASIWAAALRSLWLALVSVALSMTLALALAIAVQNLRRRWARGMVEGLGYLTIAASPLVMGTGLFLMIFPFANPVALALPVTGLVNALMSLPFVLRALVPALNDIETRYGALADSLGLTGWARLRWLYLPRLRRPLGFAAGLSAALSMGDLGVITLFADPGAATLPLQLFRLMAAYQMQAAAGAALLLLAMSLALFWIFDRGGRIDADT